MKSDMLLGYVLASKLRTKVLSVLAKRGPQRHIDVVKQLEIQSSNASPVLNALKEKGLLCNLTDNETWKVITLTKSGKELSRQIAKF